VTGLLNSDRLIQTGLLNSQTGLVNSLLLKILVANHHEQDNLALPLGSKGAVPKKGRVSIEAQFPKRAQFPNLSVIMLHWGQNCFVSNQATR